jgi:hypothetical protein
MSSHHKRRRSRRESSSPEERRHRRRRIHESSMTESSIDRLTDVMATFIQQTANKSSGFSSKGEVIPIFNPEDVGQDAVAWCGKVDELREIFHWSEEATIYFAFAKLRGLAETWYKGLPTLRWSWTQWKDKIQRAFPSKRDFYEDLGTMMRRRKRLDESYAKYLHEMTALLNACKITGTDAVSCIIGGIDDVIVKTGARAGNHQTPEALYQYLFSLVETPRNSQRASSSKIDHKTKSYKEAETGARKTIYKCFICGKTGHTSRQCYKNKDKRGKLCYVCHKAGHFEADCPSKKSGQPARPIA